MVVRTRDMPSRDYLGLVHRVVDAVERAAPAGVRVSADQGLHAILESDRQILRSQLWSAGVTVLAIGGMLWWLWRSWRLALLALGVTVLPVAAVLSVLGYAGIALNSVTVMVGAVCLGIAVDHAVHCVTYWRGQLANGMTSAEALRRTLEAKARPVWGSSLALAGVFGLFWISEFPPVRGFGGLAAAAMLAAWASVRGLLPAGLLGVGGSPRQGDHAAGL
jgi:uncharacterized protein